MSISFRSRLPLLMGIIVFLSGFLFSEDSPHICLTMIVKNESAVIERCLSQAQGFVDSICVCDTGSQDNTVEIVNALLEKNRIPGKVYHHEWKNFGHNRMCSILAAQNFLQESGCSLNNSYILILDADMVLEASNLFSKKKLTADAYLVKQKNKAGISSYNTRLIRASLPWECVGSAYEYVRCSKPCVECRLQGVQVLDMDDGGCTDRAYERDIELLSQELERQPTNAHDMLYLAHSYMLSGSHDKAIELAKRYLENSSLAEERWYALYMIGECYRMKNNWETALSWYLMSFDYRPLRAEPLQKISRHFREKGVQGIAYHFAKMGAGIPYPSGDRLFIVDSVYDYELDEDLSIAAYYCTGTKESGLAAIDRLTLKKTTPKNVRDQAYRNLEFYLQPIEKTCVYPIVFTLPKTRENSCFTYVSTNPSIQKIDDGYLVLCRTVNYKQNKGMWGGFYDPGDVQSKTRNFLLKYSKDFQLLSQKEIVEDLLDNGLSHPIIGLEDCRLFFDPIGSSKLAMTCTVCNLYSSNIPQMAYCTLEEEPSLVRVTSIVPLVGPDLCRCEKNWMPFLKNEQLNVIYSYSPFLTYVIHRKTGECVQNIRYEPQHQFANFRGSAPPISFDDGYLMLVHEATALVGSRMYTHRFLFLDTDFKIVRVSPPFSLNHTGIEFSCGMTLDHNGKNLIIACGSEDREAYLALVDCGVVRSMLRELFVV